MAILEALHVRDKTGKGSGIKTSLFESMADWMTVPLLTYEYSGKTVQRAGLLHPSICPYGAFTTQDGRAVMIAIQNDREFHRFCEQVLDRRDIPEDPKFVHNSGRVANREEITRIVSDFFATKSREEIIEGLQKAQIAYGELNHVDHLSTHPALRRTKINSPTGEINLVSPPWTMEQERHYGPVPAPGEHSTAIREEFRE